MKSISNFEVGQIVKYTDGDIEILAKIVEMANDIVTVENEEGKTFTTNIRVFDEVENVYFRSVDMVGCPDAEQLEKLEAYEDEHINAAIDMFPNPTPDRVLKELEESHVWSSMDDVIDSWLELMGCPDNLKWYINESRVEDAIAMESRYDELPSGKIVEWYNL